MDSNLLSLKSPILSASKIYYSLLSGRDGVRVVEEDWDTLVVLDACRYDMFESYHDLPGRLEKRISVGSATDEFVRRNFDSETFEDIIYVTANPRVDIVFEGHFHDIIQVWKDGWDDDLKTVPPNKTVEAAIDAHNRYPNKRVVVHFIQPHAPFIGLQARKSLKEHSTLSHHRGNADPRTKSVSNIWRQVSMGEIDRETVLQAYDENLELTLPHVLELVDSITGRTVITSDHGNLIGERLLPFMKRFYGHPVGLRAPGLVEIPWHVIEGEKRRNIVAEPPENQDESEVTESIEEKLVDLGYV